jgi:hypothetical protein
MRGKQSNESQRQQIAFCLLAVLGYNQCRGLLQSDRRDPILRESGHQQQENGDVANNLESRKVNTAGKSVAGYRNVHGCSVGDIWLFIVVGGYCFYLDNLD